MRLNGIRVLLVGHYHRWIATNYGEASSKIKGVNPARINSQKL